MTPLTLLRAARPGARDAVLRWLLVSLVLTGVIAMHVLSKHDGGGGGHHGSIIDEPRTSTAGQDLHVGHAAADMVHPAAPGVPVLTPTVPDGGGASMAACILFLVAGAGAVLLALLVALRRRLEPFAARSTYSLVTAVSRGPPLIGPPRVSLCVLRV